MDRDFVFGRRQFSSRTGSSDPNSGGAGESSRHSSSRHQSHQHRRTASSEDVDPRLRPGPIDYFSSSTSREQYEGFTQDTYGPFAIMPYETRSFGHGPTTSSSSRGNVWGSYEYRETRAQGAYTQRSDSPSPYLQRPANYRPPRDTYSDVPPLYEAPPDFRDRTSSRHIGGYAPAAIEDVHGSRRTRRPSRVDQVSDSEDEIDFGEASFHDNQHRREEREDRREDRGSLEIQPIPRFHHPSYAGTGSRSDVYEEHPRERQSAGFGGPSHDNPYLRSDRSQPGERPYHDDYRGRPEEENPSEQRSNTHGTSRRRRVSNIFCGHPDDRDDYAGNARVIHRTSGGHNENTEIHGETGTQSSRSGPSRRRRRPTFFRRERH